MDSPGRTAELDLTKVCSWIGCDRPPTSGSARGECPEHFRARLRSLRLDSSVTETRTKVNYFDSAALDDAFGSDRVERYWEETKGHGAIHRGPDGELYHRDHTGEVKVATDKVIDDITSGEDAADVV